MNINFDKAIKCNDIVIDTEQLEQLGFSFEKPEDFVCYITSLSSWLESHNKNYTKEQYHKISLLNDLLKCIGW